MAVVATAAKGAVVAIGDGATVETFNALGNVLSGPNAIGFEPQFIEAMPHDSTNPISKPTYVKNPAITFDVLYDSADTQHAAVVTSAKNKTKKNYKITLTDTGAEIYSFGAYASVSVKADPEGFNVMSVTLTPDGGITYA